MSADLVAATRRRLQQQTERTRTTPAQASALVEACRDQWRFDDATAARWANRITGLDLERIGDAVAYVLDAWPETLPPWHVVGNRYNELGDAETRRALIETRDRGQA